MPKRTRQQQDKHNENRRKVKKEGKKSIVCMQYIGIKYPKIYAEACKLHDYISAVYPGKRDLTRTPEFKRCTEDESVKNSMLQPMLQIPLMPKQIHSTLTTTTSKEMPQTQSNQTEEIPPVIDVDDQEIQKMIAELRQDPDLTSIFKDFELPSDDIPVETIVIETSTTECVQQEEIPSSFISEIDEIIQEFDALGENFPNIIDNDDQIFW